MPEALVNREQRVEKDEVNVSDKLHFGDAGVNDARGRACVFVCALGGDISVENRWVLVGGLVGNIPWDAVGVAELSRVEHDTLVGPVESSADTVKVVQGSTFGFATSFTIE